MRLCVPPPGAVRGADCQDLHEASVIDCCEDTAVVCDDLKIFDSLFCMLLTILAVNVPEPENLNLIKRGGERCPWGTAAPDSLHFER